jgi:hypothetical protein
VARAEQDAGLKRNHGRHDPRWSRGRPRSDLSIPAMADATRARWEAACSSTSPCTTSRAGSRPPRARNRGARLRDPRGRRAGARRRPATLSGELPRNRQEHAPVPRRRGGRRRSP